MAKENKQNRLYLGTVVSDKMNKTIVVEFDHIFKHPKFHKVVRKTKRYKVHDEHNQAKVGDKVEFYVGKPVSKLKCRYLSRVVTPHTA